VGIFTTSQHALYNPLSYALVFVSIFSRSQFTNFTATKRNPRKFFGLLWRVVVFAPTFGDISTESAKAFSTHGDISDHVYLRPAHGADI